MTDFDVHKRVLVLEAELKEIIEHTYCGDKTLDPEGSDCLTGLQLEAQAVLRGERLPHGFVPPVQPPGSESREARLEKALRECLTEAENQFQWAQATHCDDCDPGDEGREVWADILGSINRALAPIARPPSPEKQQGFASDQPASGYGGGEFNRPPPEKQRGDKT